MLGFGQESCGGLSVYMDYDKNITCEQCGKETSVLDVECFNCGPQAREQKFSLIKKLVPFLYERFQRKPPSYKRSVADCRSFLYMRYKREFLGKSKIEAFEAGFANGYKDGFEDAATFLLSTLGHTIDKSDLDDLEGLAKGLQWRFTDSHPYRKLL